jgi:peptidoglycan/LPS O-acetylase OafA/YrhL
VTSPDPSTYLAAKVGSQVQPARVGGHLDHVHNFRGLAAIFIVTTHTISLFDWSASPSVERILKYAFANGTVFFLFISGYLFEYLITRFRTLDFWANKLRYVVLPYFLISIPAVYISTTVMRREGLAADFYSQPIGFQIIELLLTGSHLAPFWFIPTIVAFYVAAPILHAVFRTNLSFWLLPLLFLIPVWFWRDPNPALNLLHFLPIWVLGMACCRFRSHVEPMLVRWLWSLLLLVVVLSVLEMELTTGTHTYWGYLQKSALSLFLLALLLRFGRAANGWFAWIGTLSFGVFFLHSYVITAAKLTLTKLNGELPAGSVSGLFLASLVAVLVTSALVIATQRTLGPRSRMVIGV